MLLSRIAFAAMAVATASTTLSAQTDAKTPAKDDGFVQLFNGKDLTGWKIHPNANPAFSEIFAVKEGDTLVGYNGKLKKGGEVVPLWRVEDGVLIGSGPSTHLFSEKGDYTDVKFRVVAAINDKGNSGMYFRTKFAPGFPPGYEVQINATGGDPIKTGSLYPDGRTKLKEFKKEICVMNTAAHKPDEFFTQQVVAVGNHITITVNGEETIDFTDANMTYKKGHFALQGHDPGTVVKFKTVEYQSLAK